MITINASYYKRLAKCWERKDSPFVKKEKTIKEIKSICKENKNISKKDVIEVLIADMKGQISNNTFLQIAAIGVTFLVVFISEILKNSIGIYISLAMIGILFLLLFYSLRYLYAEGFILHILEGYLKK